MHPCFLRTVFSDTGRESATRIKLLRIEMCKRPIKLSLPNHVIEYDAAYVREYWKSRLCTTEEERSPGKDCIAEKVATCQAYLWGRKKFSMKLFGVL